MLKRISHITLSLWLAIILLFGNTPKEFIHLFANHTDTVHSRFEKNGLVIEPEHHHCTFLSYALPLFLNDNHAIVFCESKFVYPQYHQSYIVSVHVRTPHILSLRGPPVA